MDTTTVAGLNQQPDVGVHEGNSHGDIGTVRQDEVRVLAEVLDEGEDVIPAATVETSAVVTELIDDLIHFKSSVDSLDQDGTTDGTTGNADVVLRQVEDVVPQAGLEVRLHLGEIEVGAGATGNELLGVVEEVQTKVKQTTGDGLAVNGEVLLLEVPASSTADQSSKGTVSTELVLLATLREVDLTTHGIVQVNLAIDHVVPGGSARVCALS